VIALESGLAVIKERAGLIVRLESHVAESLELLVKEVILLAVRRWRNVKVKQQKQLQKEKHQLNV